MELLRSRPLLAALALAALALTSGCNLAPRIEVVEQDGRPPVFVQEPFDWPRPIRVGVLQNRGRHDELHRRVVGALADGIDRLERDYRPSGATRVDYVVDVDLKVTGSGRGTNFFVVFPGFLIFAPTWHQLTWDFQVETEVRLLRGQDLVQVRQVELSDRFEAHYTPPGMAVGAYLGWCAVLFPPMIVSPAVTAIVAAADDWDPRRFAMILARDAEAGRVFSRRVAHKVREAIDADLRLE